MILLIFAFVCFVLAAIPYKATDPYTTRLIAAGLACYMGHLIFGK